MKSASDFFLCLGWAVAIALLLYGCAPDRSMDAIKPKTHRLESVAYEGPITCTCYPEEDDDDTRLADR